MVVGVLSVDWRRGMWVAVGGLAVQRSRQHFWGRQRSGLEVRARSGSGGRVVISD